MADVYRASEGASSFDCTKRSQRDLLGARLQSQRRGFILRHDVPLVGGLLSLVYRASEGASSFDVRHGDLLTDESIHMTIPFLSGFAMGLWAGLVGTAAAVHWLRGGA